MLKLARFAVGTETNRLGIVLDDVVLDITISAGANADLQGLLAWLPDQLRKMADIAIHIAPRHALHDVTLLPPVANPSKIFCVGKNSRKHREELAARGLLNENPQEPTGFVKLVSTLVGEGARVERPVGICTLDYEPELAFIISKPAHRVDRSQARASLGGITVLNDLTARAIQKQEVASGTRFWTAKNMPGFCPMGPMVVPLWDVPDPYDLWLTCAVNGEQRLRVNTSEHIFQIDEILEYFSRYLPFEPGDVISTGAPRGTAMSHANAAELYLRPGDICVAGIEGVMDLTTHIIAPNETASRRPMCDPS